jgi:hypothetical protein
MHVLRKCFWLSLLLLPLGALANECIQDTSLSPLGLESNLPRYVGSLKADAMRPYPALCDTMYVRIGDTSTIYGGTLYHFSNPRFRNRELLVQGHLQLAGSPALSVSLAGSMNDTGLVLMAGSERWGGIKVMPGGSLDASHVLLTRADTVLDLQSQNVSLYKVRQKNCKIWIDTGRVLRALDAGSDLPNVGIPSTESGPSQAKSFWQRPATYWWAGGVVGVAAVSGVVTYSMLSGKDGGVALKPSPEFGRTPDLPEDPR